jgi:uncharacterized protein (DUF2235 family)
MTKNIVIFSDGTGQEGGVGHNTNVYKLYNMVLDRSPDQIAYYDKGIGTGTLKVMTNIGGFGISKNILDCYRFIFDNYQAGDKIYLFGFSRGATTVRSLSNFIHLFGMLPKSRHELIRQAYDIYKISKAAKRARAAEDFINRHHTMWCKIHFIGVWDTVAALGVPNKTIDAILNKVPFFRHKFQTLNLSESVIHARHALAVDEERKTFLPTLWDTNIKSGQTMKQVWFPGVHTDVGGGYEEQRLSDIPLLWMIREAEENGLRIYDKHKVELNPQYDGQMHDSRGGAGFLYPKKIRSWPTDTHGRPHVHESVSDRRLNQKNEPEPPYEPWVLNEKYESIEEN